MDIATSQPPLVFLLVFSEVLGDFITLLWARGFYRFLGGWWLQDSHQGFTGGGQIYCCNSAHTHNYKTCPFCNRWSLLNCASWYDTVMPRSCAVYGCSPLCVADSSWVSEVPWIFLSRIVFFQTVFHFSKIFFNYYYFLFHLFTTCSAFICRYHYVWERNLLAWFFNKHLNENEYRHHYLLEGICMYKLQRKIVQTINSENLLKC